MTREIVSTTIALLQTRNLLGKMRVRSSSNFVFSCPFTANHGGRVEQSTPSFAIHEESGKWHCFSCGRGSRDIYALFANLVGLTIELARDTIGEPRFSPNYVMDQLEALRKGQTGLEPQPMEPYPKTVPAWESPEAATYLRGRGIPQEVMVLASLQYYSGDYLPTFSGKQGASGKRIILPITHKGEIVGYSGRMVFEGSGSKYYRPITNVNSCVYNPANVSPLKTKVVFAVEGEFSALACIREGLPAVATFGANIGAEQAKFFVRFPQVILLFDPDVTGDSGAAKAYTFMRGYTQVRKFNLPGADPADMPLGFGKTLMEMAETPPKEVNPLDQIENLLRCK